jgi:hypothetical protein
MVKLTIGYVEPKLLSHDVSLSRHNGFKINKICHQMGGDGIGKFFKNLFSKSMSIYKKVKPSIQQGLQYYDKAKDIASKAQQIYKSDEFQGIKNKLPKNVLQKEEQFLQKAKPYFDKAKEKEKQIFNLGRMADENIINLDNKINQKEENIAGSGLKKKLLLQYGKGTKLAGSGMCGSGDMLAGSGMCGSGDMLAGSGMCGSGDMLAGSGMCGNGWGDILKLGAQMIPTIIQQTGNGMNNDAKQALLNHSMKQYKKNILNGSTYKKLQSGKGIGDIFKSIASAVITPLNVISNIGKRASGQSGEGKKKMLIKGMKKKIEKDMMKAYKTRMKGSGPSFGDILGGIADTASHILPFLL